MAMQYLDMTGRTEEEAVQKALRQLGLDRDDVSVEVLERAKSGFFGFGASPAKVRVTYGLEDYPTRFWSYVAISLVSLAALVYLFCFCRKNKKVFYRSTLVALSGVF